MKSLWLLIVLIALARTTTADDARFDPLVERLDELRVKHDVPALGVVIVNESGPVAIQVVGVRKRGNLTAASTEDMFHLGSNTKAMTSTLLATFVEEGMLTWDSRLADVLPQIESPNSIGDSTVNQVLTHTAGFSSNPSFGWHLAPAKPTLPELRLWFIEQSLHTKRAARPATFVYSNLGYVAAGVMAETLGKKSWEDLLAERVFRPLKITHFGFGCAATMGEAIDQPWPHGANGRPVSPNGVSDNPPALGPAGRVHIRLADYGVFLQDQLRGARGQPGLLKPETYHVLHTPLHPEDSYAPGGWGVKSQRELKCLMHAGSNTMNLSVTCIVPEKGVAFSVCTNQAGEAGRNACDAVLNEILNVLAN